MNLLKTARQYLAKFVGRIKVLSKSPWLKRSPEATAHTNAHADDVQTAVHEVNTIIEKLEEIDKDFERVRNQLRPKLVPWEPHERRPKGYKCPEPLRKIQENPNGTKTVYRHRPKIIRPTREPLRRYNRYRPHLTGTVWMDQHEKDKAWEAHELEREKLNALAERMVQSQEDFASQANHMFRQDMFSIMTLLEKTNAPNRIKSAAFKWIAEELKMAQNDLKVLNEKWGITLPKPDI